MRLTESENDAHRCEYRLLRVLTDMQGELNLVKAARRRDEEEEKSGHLHHLEQMRQTGESVVGIGSENP